MNIDTMEKLEKFYQKNIQPNLDKVVIIALIIGFVVLGIFSSDITLYIFGLVFFIAGFFAGACGPKVFGLIFLFSHGGTGLSLMFYTLCGKYFNSPKITDTPNFMQYASIVVLLLFVATGCVFVSNLTNPFDSGNMNEKTSNKKKWYYVLPLSLYFVATLLTIYFFQKYL